MEPKEREVKEHGNAQWKAGFGLADSGLRRRHVSISFPILIIKLVRWL
jgi:hypothetical protein